MSACPGRFHEATLQTTAAIDTEDYEAITPERTFAECIL